MSLFFLLLPLAHAQEAPRVTGVDSVGLHPRTGMAPWMGLAALPTDRTAGWGASLHGGYARAPLAWRPDPSQPETELLVEDVGSAEVGAWWQGERIHLGLAAPVALADGAQIATAGLRAGDLRAEARARIATAGALTLGARLDATAPTGDETAALGAARPTAGGGVVATVGLGPVTLLADLGGTSGPGAATDTDLDPGAAFTGALGAAWAVAPAFTLTTEAHTSVYGRLDEAAAPVEVLGGFQVVAGGGWTVRAAGGGGVTAGVGAPAARALVGVTWSAPPAEPAPQPVVAEAPEEEPDAGTLSLTLRDEAGNALTAQVFVVGQKGERRFAARDGAMRVPLPPGSYSVKLRADGHMPIDRALTVVAGEAVHLDAVLPTARVRIEGDRVVLSERIYFETGSAVLDRRSFPLLDQVAATLLRHPELTRVAIRGHTDDRGEDEANLDLSLKRAQSVENYLVQSGVARNRLQAFGLGERQPLVLGETAEARAANRRVEFHITGRDTAAPNTPTTAQAGGTP